MNRTPRLLAILSFVAAPLSAQTWLDHPPTFEVQLLADGTWHLASRTTVGDCATFTLDSERQADGSFIARRFSGVKAVRYIDGAGIQRQLTDSDLTALANCGSSTPATTTTDCGSAPAMAQGAIAGAVYGHAGSAGSGSPWDITLGVAQKDIVPITDAATCRKLVLAAGAGQASDTLALLGVVNVGGVAFAVVRGIPMGTGTPHGGFSTYLMNPALEVVSARRFNY